MRWKRRTERCLRDPYHNHGATYMVENAYKAGTYSALTCGNASYMVTRISDDADVAFAK